MLDSLADRVPKFCGSVTVSERDQMVIPAEAPPRSGHHPGNQAHRTMRTELQLADLCHSRVCDRVHHQPKRDAFRV